MPEITDRPPYQVQADLDSLAAAPDSEIPVKATDNLLIATWNIRSFGSLTREWTATSNDKPKRDLRGLRATIEILSRFDVIALQEVKGDLCALRDTMRFLEAEGEDWAFLMTDVTRGKARNYERLAFLFHRTRVKRALTNLNLRVGGNFDFMPYVYTDTPLTRRLVSYRISDHYPLWVEFVHSARDV